ncbi:MAG: hypothetical protein OHK0037_37030 [Elainellaceae cyanobacterium]
MVKPVARGPHDDHLRHLLRQRQIFPLGAKLGANRHETGLVLSGNERGIVVFIQSVVKLVVKLVV